MQDNEKLSKEDLHNQIEKEAELLAKNADKNEVLVPEAVGSPQPEAQQAKITSLGKAQRFLEQEEDILAAEIGWKNIPLDILPSRGMFYPEGTQIAIRAASVAEIRHWSTIDENDVLGTDDMLNFVIEKCCRIKIPGKPGNYRDTKEIDRFFLVFAIRDYTFKNGENKLVMTVSDDDGVEEKVEVTKDSLDYFNPDERIMKYYNSQEKCFILELKNGEMINLYLPTLGIMNFIKNYIRTKQTAGKNFDKAFIKYAPFLFSDWKTLTQPSYDKAVQESLIWSLSKISVLNKMVEILGLSINPQIRYMASAGGERTAPLNFPGGIKSIFLISDIFGELV